VEVTKQCFVHLPSKYITRHKFVCNCFLSLSIHINCPQQFLLIGLALITGEQKYDDKVFAPVVQTKIAEL